MLEPTEMKILEKFFHEKLVAKHDMKQSFKELEQLFEPFKFPSLLQRRIIESFVLSSETVSNKFLLILVIRHEILFVDSNRK